MQLESRRDLVLFAGEESFATDDFDEFGNEEVAKFFLRGRRRRRRRRRRKRGNGEEKKRDVRDVSGNVSGAAGVRGEDFDGDGVGERGDEANFVRDERDEVWCCARRRRIREREQM